MLAMSIKAMNWAWEQQLSCSRKLVLMAIADAADDSGDCWPKVKTIAKKCNLSGRTVQRIIKMFSEEGLLELTPRFSPEGRQISNNYRLLFTHRCPDKLSSSARKSQDGGASSMSPSAMTELCHADTDSVVADLQPPLEPKKKTSAALRLRNTLGGEARERCRALVAGLDSSDAQALLDGMERALKQGRIRTTPEQWLWGAVRAKSRPRGAGMKTKQAYRDELVRAGLPADMAEEIAYKTVVGDASD